MRVGIGYDSHAFTTGRPLIIGGVKISEERGLMGHSDADVLTHAIIDAIIGAAGIGDIGKHFPDTEPRWKGADSMGLLRIILERIRQMGLEVHWIDSTVVIESPKIGPFIEEMKSRYYQAGIKHGRINIKAKTNEGMGFVGRGEGAVAMAVVSLTEAE
ncbi:MAG: 2-C-methyl-D-erythritol 2,4-cyclodiphosphate synthase [Nitrospirae bacterium]|nr:MAG: 2-C-methyl-D-erythritol 2,4-cyclodiphosphate synthase [Nitrospirota bacterium]